MAGGESSRLKVLIFLNKRKVKIKSRREVKIGERNKVREEEKV